MADEFDINNKTSVDTSDIANLNIDNNIKIEITSNDTQKSKEEPKQKPQQERPLKDKTSSFNEILKSIESSLKSIQDAAIAVKDVITGTKASTTSQGAAENIKLSPTDNLETLIQGSRFKTDAKDILVVAFSETLNRADVQESLKNILESINTNSTVIENENKSETLKQNNISTLENSVKTDNQSLNNVVDVLNNINNVVKSINDSFIRNEQTNDKNINAINSYLKDTKESFDSTVRFFSRKFI